MRVINVGHIRQQIPSPVTFIAAIANEFIDKLTIGPLCQCLSLNRIMLPIIIISSIKVDKV